MHRKEGPFPTEISRQDLTELSLHYMRLQAHTSYSCVNFIIIISYYYC